MNDTPDPAPIAKQEAYIRGHIGQFIDAKYSRDDVIDAAYQKIREYDLRITDTRRDEIVDEEIAKVRPNGEDKNGWPKLDNAALHGLAGDIVKACTIDSEIDPPAILVTTLSMAGCLYGNRIYVPVGEDKHHPRIFAAIVGASSRARKGMSLKPVKRILQAGEQIYINSTGDKPFPTGASLKISHGPLSSGEGLIYAIRDASDKRNKDGDLIDEGVDDKRLFCIESEFGSVLKMGERKGNSLSTTMRQAWDGDTLAPMTKNNPICATDPHISIIGHITQEELKVLLTTVDVWNGFSNRFVWLCVKRKRLVAFPCAIPNETVINLSQRFCTTIKHAAGRDKVNLTADAAQLWRSKYERLSADHDGAFGAITSRSEAQVMRFSLIYALLGCSGSIEVDHLKAALALWDYCEQSAFYIFGGVETDPRANRILEALKTGSMTQTDINNLFDRNVNKHTLEALLDRLVTHNKIERVQKPPEGRKGRPTTIFKYVFTK